MKRTVIFSEGKRDLNLIRLFFYQYHDDVEIEHMVGEDIEPTRRKKQESEWFELLVSDWNDTEVLVKSEEGKENLVEVFTHIVRYVTEHDARIVFLVDLDGGEIDSVEEDIREKVEDRFRGQRLTVERRDECEEGELTFAESSLVSDSGDESIFYVLGFEHSMETSAGIDKEKDSKCDEARKMYELLEQDEFWRTFDKPVFQGELS
jgi:hypothetical protein